MYLSKVNLSNENKELFIDLSTLLVTAEPRDGGSIEILDSLDMLKDKKLLDLDVEKVNYFIPSLVEVEAIKVCLLELGELKRNTDSIVMSFFKVNYSDPIQTVLDEALSNPEYNKQVLTHFIERGVGLSEIDEIKSMKAMAQLPEVRRRLVDVILEQAFEKLKLEELSTTDRKILLFELVALAHADGNVHELEALVINTVADKFQIDETTLGELKDSAQEVITAVNDAAEIIFE